MSDFMIGFLMFPVIAVILGIIFCMVNDWLCDREMR